jgi:hypothetical protein
MGSSRARHGTQPKSLQNRTGDEQNATAEPAARRVGLLSPVRGVEPPDSPASPPQRVGTVALIALPLVALGSSFVLFLAYISIISALPRPMEGESIMIPWSVCLVGYVALPALLPWLVALPFLRHRGLRTYLLCCLVVAVLVWYFVFGFDSLLVKAYRRGL